MCQISAAGNTGMPFTGNIVTGIEACQRTGVFINGANADVILKSGGVAFVVPAGMAATVPISQDIWLSGGGSGVLAWTVTDAVLTAELCAAPQMPRNADEATAAAAFAPKSEPTIFAVVNSGVLTLSSGDYTKLTITQHQAGEA